MAGNIGLYPANMCLIDPQGLILQYKQIKYNYNKVLRLESSNEHLIWQQVTKSAIIYISGDANIDLLLPYLRKDFSFLSQACIVLRVPKLPMNSLIEIELVGDTRLNSASDGTILKPQPVSCK